MPRKARAPVRLLLVELMPENPERQRRTQSYPYLAAAAKRFGGEASWIAFGVRWEPALRYELPPAELRRLLAEIARREPGVVVINEELSAAQRAAVEEEGAKLVYCRLDENFMEQFREFTRGLGFSKREKELDDPGFLERLEPDFRREVLNAAPWAGAPLIRVVAGARCAYRTLAKDNPFYRALKPATAAMSCSFCGVPAQADPIADPAAFAARQVAAACRERARPGVETRCELIGARIWPRLEEFIREAVRLGVRDAELSFMPRIDEILAARAAITRCLPLLAKNGLALRLYGAGVENFSPAENARLNKGVAAAQVHEAAAFIEETRARAPGAFRFRNGDLGMILFTPWTTLDDVRVNLENIERCALILPAAAIGTRLQLFEGRDAARLAAKDGLLVEKSSAGFFNSGCIVSADQSELPWRFARPQAGVLCELGRELSLRAFGPRRDDARARRVAALAGKDPTGLAAFRRGLEALAANPRLASLDALLDALEAA